MSGTLEFDLAEPDTIFHFRTTDEVEHEFSEDTFTFDLGDDQMSVEMAEAEDVDVEFEGAVVDIGEDLVKLTAADPLSGHRVATVNDDHQAIYADNTNIAHLHAILGVTIGAAEAGALVSVCTHGPITESSWNWTPRYPIYLGASGVLTQTPPAGAFVVIVGWAMSKTKMMVDPKMPIRTC